MISARPAIPFVGREHELRRLPPRFERAIEGQRRIVLIAGEPDTGKTRTAEEFTGVAGERPLVLLLDDLHEAGGPSLRLVELAQLFVQAAGSLARAHDLLDEASAGPAPVPARAASNRDGLTAREREVLQLLGLRLSNNEIAAALVLSVRTVERHIANIYTKTGSHSRREARCFAERYGLIAPHER